MIFWHLVLISVIQGLTDPLPVSSSGHLVLFHQLVGGGELSGAAAAQAREIDIAVHIGTLGALIFYFWHDVRQLTKGSVHMILGKASSAEAKMLQYLFVASVPAVIAGFLLAQLDAEFFYDLERLAILNIVFGLLLYVADKWGKNILSIDNMSFKASLFFGLSQVLALIPGVSRSGVTMTAGRAMGFDRMSAAKFSLLMALIITAGAGAMGIYSVLGNGGFSSSTAQFLWAIGLSFIASYVALVLLMKFLKNYDFTPFMIYRVLFGVVILGAIYSGFLA